MAERNTETQGTSATPSGPVGPGGPAGPWGPREPGRPPRWLPWAAAALMSLVVGILAYNFGVSQSAATQAAGEGVRRWHGYRCIAIAGGRLLDFGELSQLARIHKGKR